MYTLLKKTAFIALAFVLMTSSAAHAQVKTSGTDFWLSFMPSVTTRPGFQVIISSETGASGTLTLSSSGKQQQFTVPANSSINIHLQPSDSVVANSDETIVKRAIHITSDYPVTVYAVAEDVYNSDAMMVLPSGSSGIYHMIHTYTSAYAPSMFVYDYTQFMVVATADHTPVEIIPSQTTLQGSPANIPLYITLNAGECYLVRAIPELTGSTVRSLDSCKTLTVVEGNACTYVPGNTLACNKLIEQSIPVADWGKEFITMPFKTREYYVLRLLAAENNTQFSIDNGAPFTLNAGMTYELFSLYETHYISADKPLKVMQYAVGTTVDSVDGDPTVMYVPPLGENNRKTIFESPTTHIIENNQVVPLITNSYLNILTETSKTDGLYLDGIPIPPADFNIIPQFPAYSYVLLDVAQGNHVLQHTTGTFSAHIYGFAYADAYSTFAGGYPVLPGVYIVYKNDTIPAGNFNDTLGCSDSLLVFVTEDPSAKHTGWVINNGDMMYQNPLLITEYQFGKNILQVIFAADEKPCPEPHQIFYSVFEADIKTIAEAQFHVPNIFTPNGDGINDEWFISPATSGTLGSYHLYIYNRWGMLIWESNDPTEKWDGRSNNRPAEEGTYYYRVDSACFPQTGKTGFITLTR